MKKSQSPEHAPRKTARNSKKTELEIFGQPAEAPMTCGRAAEPHYDDTIPPHMPADELLPTPDATPPGAEPMAPGSQKTPDRITDKIRALDCHRADGTNMALTDSRGVRVADNQNTLSAGERGPLLVEDFHFTEKLAHFDRERIPERVVHARGSGAHGWFQVYESCAEFTKAAFLCDPTVKTPVFVRFSTVQGFRGSADTVRDIRGFSTKFYTSEGNFDLVGNDTPVFFIQDPIKFPDFVHAVKPEPHNEVPQGQSAHDTLWDYVSLQPETLHNIMWAMSDRGIPRSFRTMEGFGIHTFRMVNAEGRSCFVRFHWKPKYGKASLIWDEAQLITGRDPDFHRKDLWQAIEAGDCPEFELGLQIIPEEDEHKFGFDILDATKLIPEALVPVRIVGRMVLDRNPDDFFAETEQVAFCPANLVPGIDFSDDPLLQGRVFSYTDTQRHRLGTANFNEIPINKPLVPVRNHQRNGFFRTQIAIGPNYEPNSIGNNWPRETPPDSGGFRTLPPAALASEGAPAGPLSRQARCESAKGKEAKACKAHADSAAHTHSHGPCTSPCSAKMRLRSPSFADYYTQPRFFWLSLTKPEQKHTADAFAFELSKVYRPYIRERVVDLLTRIDTDLARCVAEQLGIKLTEEQLGRTLPGPVAGLESDPALSLYATGEQVIKGRRVALLTADGVNEASVDAMRRALAEQGVHTQVLAPHMGFVSTEEGGMLKVDGTIGGTPSVLFDAVAVPEGKSLEALSQCGKTRHYLWQAYRHLKAIALPRQASALLLASGLPENASDPGLVAGRDIDGTMQDFISAMKQHRVWEREKANCSMPMGQPA